MKNFINPAVTIPKGYVVIDCLSDSKVGNNIKGILKLIAKLEKSNIVLSDKAIASLSKVSKEDFVEISDSIKSVTKKVQGQFLRPSFASTDDVALEAMTYEDLCVQMWMYFNTYGLGRFPSELWEFSKDREVQLENVSNKSTVQDLNCTFKIIDVKTTSEFVKEVQNVASIPIVFGAQQLELLKEANKHDLLVGSIKGLDVKVKENLFSIIELIGKEYIVKANLLSTATDVLRYAYFVSGEDYKKLEASKFSLKTSDKRVIMESLNNISKTKDIKEVFGDMKPNKSLWLSMSKNLFPGSKKFNKYSNAQGLFDYIRNGGTVETFNSITQRLINEEKFGELARHLSKKPGELLRNLDMIIRKSSKEEVKELSDVVKNIKLNPKLVIQVKKWLEYRTSTSFTDRVFNVKGKPVLVDDKPLKELRTKRTMKVVQALNEILKESLVGKSLFPISKTAEIA